MKFEYVNPQNITDNAKVENEKKESERSERSEKSDTSETVNQTKDENNQKEEKESSSNENIFDEIKGAYRIRSEDEMRYLLELTDLTFLKFTYVKTSSKSLSVAKYIKSISEKLNFLAGIILIDCETFNPREHNDCQTNEYVIDSFPKIKLLIPPEVRYDAVMDVWDTHSEIPWTEKEMTESTIYNYCTTNIPNKSKKIDQNNAYGFFASNTMNKIVLFTDKSAPTLLFKGLTNYFYDRIAFGIIKSSEEGLVNKFNITKFPTLILYKTIDKQRLLDEPEIIVYEGLPKAEKLNDFIEPHTLSEKFHYKMKRGVIEHDIREMTQNLNFTNLTPKNYEKIFEKLGDKNIVVYFDKKFRMKNAYKQYFVRN